MAGLETEAADLPHALCPSGVWAEAAEARCATLERERDEARRLGDFAVRARDHYDEDRRKAVQEMGGWKARAEHAEANLAACREAQGQMTRDLYVVSVQRNEAMAERDALKADRDRLAAALTKLRAYLTDELAELRRDRQRYAEHATVLHVLAELDRLTAEAGR